MDKITSFKIQETNEPEDEEEEEALSLCDLPLNSDEPKTDIHHRRRSSSQLPDFFEFFNDPISSDETNMSHAEDIISGGKLVPFYRQSPPLIPDDQTLKSLSAGDEYNSANFSRRYCDSLPEMNPTRSNTHSADAAAATELTRSSRSLDWRKLRRNSSLVMKSEASDVHRSLSSGSRPSRWYSLMFGPVMFSPEMDLRDMKSRQVRRKVAVDGGGKSPVNRRSSWGNDLLSVLSCKNHASVAVVKPSSVGFLPRV
ncbi:hypothetical protein ABFS82_10G136500 [Erythranthe guttata]|uniref:Uncharacterized protein n=1 Tax=Erythranthe guttata TaxID=4155 RepID=A0A022RQY9_ERYGU|nr:PREDICTED: uncharacterized protein LOC105952246 [Erythranthe guttata]EYU42406.1 hypothetical protein MIMGU_mgv1a012307mg [Erythranthe guttata]|eukprot:XP_012831234.1 PREDICTED: uncharacterized protein LOC105952246 [Erythranthe guttata]